MCHPAIFQTRRIKSTLPKVNIFFGLKNSYLISFVLFCLETWIRVTKFENLRFEVTTQKHLMKRGVIVLCLVWKMAGLTVFVTLLQQGFGGLLIAVDWSERTTHVVKSRKLSLAAKIHNYFTQNKNREDGGHRRKIAILQWNFLLLKMTVE